jgi:hypothetical protein
MGARRGVSRGVEDGLRPPALWAGYTQKGRKAVSGVARQQGIQGSGIVGLGKTLGSPRSPLALRLWMKKV